MNTQKGFAPILSILLILVVIGGGIYYFISTSEIDNKINIQSEGLEIASSSEEVKLPINNSQDTSNTLKWETYTNDNIGYKISYPANWWDANNNRVLNPERAGKPDTGTPMEAFSVTTMSTEIYNALCAQGKDSILDGYPVTDSGWKIGYGLIYHRTICQKERSTMVSMSVFNNKEGNIDEKSKKTFEDILSTFKFLRDKEVYNINGIKLIYTPQTYKIGDTVTLKYKLNDLYKDYDVLVDLKPVHSEGLFIYGNRKAGLPLKNIDKETVSFVLEDAPDQNLIMRKGEYDLCIWISIKGDARDCLYGSIEIE